MKKLTVALVVIFLLFVGYRYLDFSHKEKMLSEQKQRTDERDALLTRVGESCKSAIRSAVSPRPILDFSYSYGSNTTDFGGFGQTDTGYSYRVIADFGNDKIRLKCYMDQNFKILKVAEDQ